MDSPATEPAKITVFDDACFRHMTRFGNFGIGEKMPRRTVDRDHGGRLYPVVEPAQIFLGGMA